MHAKTSNPSQRTTLPYKIPPRTTRQRELLQKLTININSRALFQRSIFVTILYTMHQYFNPTSTCSHSNDTIGSAYLRFEIIWINETGRKQFQLTISQDKVWREQKYRDNYNFREVLFLQECVIKHQTFKIGQIGQQISSSFSENFHRWLQIGLNSPLQVQIIDIQLRFPVQSYSFLKLLPSHVISLRIIRLQFYFLIHKIILILLKSFYLSQNFHVFDLIFINLLFDPSLLGPHLHLQDIYLLSLPLQEQKILKSKIRTIFFLDRVFNFLIGSNFVSDTLLKFLLATHSGLPVNQLDYFPVSTFAKIVFFDLIGLSTLSLFPHNLSISIILKIMLICSIVSELKWFQIIAEGLQVQFFIKFTHQTCVESNSIQAIQLLPILEEKLEYLTKTNYSSFPFVYPFENYKRFYLLDLLPPDFQYSATSYDH